MVAASSPASTRSSVVLPVPDRPTTATIVAVRDVERHVPQDRALALDSGQAHPQRLYPVRGRDGAGVDR